jgi:hypothetical protein
MYRIIDGKGTGKTGRLLLLAKENNGVIVCANPERMRERAHSYGITDIVCVNYATYLEFMMGYGNSSLVGKKVFIDEIDTFLSVFADDIQGYTLSLD